MSGFVEFLKTQKLFELALYTLPMIELTIELDRGVLEIKFALKNSGIRLKLDEIS